MAGDRREGAQQEYGPQPVFSSCFLAPAIPVFPLFPISSIFLQLISVRECYVCVYSDIYVVCMEQNEKSR